MQNINRPVCRKTWAQDSCGNLGAQRGSLFPSAKYHSTGLRQSLSLLKQFVMNNNERCSPSITIIVFIIIIFTIVIQLARERCCCCCFFTSQSQWPSTSLTDYVMTHDSWVEAKVCISLFEHRGATANRRCARIVSSRRLTWSLSYSSSS